MAAAIKYILEKELCEKSGMILLYPSLFKFQLPTIDGTSLFNSEIMLTKLKILKDKAFFSFNKNYEQN